MLALALAGGALRSNPREIALALAAALTFCSPLLSSPYPPGLLSSPPVSRLLLSCALAVALVRGDKCTGAVIRREPRPRPQVCQQAAGNPRGDAPRLLSIIDARLPLHATRAFIAPRK